MKDRSDSLYKTLDESLEDQPRQYSLNKFILKYIRGKDILDVGCGSGTLIKILLQKGFEAVGCDSSVSQCKLAKKRLRDAGLPSKFIKHISLKKISSNKKKFDTVICLDVLEHIKNDMQAIKLLAKLVKPNGELIVLVPAMPELWGKRDEEYGHYRRYTKDSLKSLVSNSELKIKILRYWNFVGAITAFIMFKIGLDLESDKISISTKQPFVTINALIRLWLNLVEQYPIFPFGMSLLAVLEKP